MLASEEQLVSAAAHLIIEANHAVAFTGAGISTASGIPDFRSRGTGTWANINPMKVASMASFLKHPDTFYDWIRPLAQQIFTSEPNPAHYALAELERTGRLTALITQNIDRLHRRAGSQRMFELHGDISTARCLSCDFTYTSNQFIDKLLQEAHTLPTCEKCQSIMKPNIILFGEMLPEMTMCAAEKTALNCDLMIVAGSSLQVFPAADLPSLAHRNGASLIIINREETCLDIMADVVLRSDVSEVLPLIASRLTTLRTTHSQRMK